MRWVGGGMLRGLGLGVEGAGGAIWAREGVDMEERVATALRGLVAAPTAPLPSLWIWAAVAATQMAHGEEQVEE